MAGGGNGPAGPSKPFWDSGLQNLQKGFVTCQTQFGGMVASLCTQGVESGLLLFLIKEG